MPLIAKKSKANFFLSRPRRFGKSLFVSTLEYVFLGKKEMFKGLYIYDKIEWETFPVIRLSMDAIGFQDADLKDALYAEIKSKAKKEALILEETHYARAFAEFIQKLAKKHQKRVVVLIDEYDKPIIHGIEKDNADLAETNRDILKSFYGILKDSGEYCALFL